MSEDLKDKILEDIARVIDHASPETAVTVIKIVLDYYKKAKLGEATVEEVRAELARFLGVIEAERPRGNKES